MWKMTNNETIFQLIEDYTLLGQSFYNPKTKCYWYLYPKTGDWIFEQYKNKFLWYNKDMFDEIFKYISCSYPQYEIYILNWFEQKFKVRPENIWFKQKNREFEIKEFFPYLCV